MPRLVFIDKDFAGRINELASGTTTVGRGDHNLLVIHHKSVSSDHCKILVFGTEVIVRDKDSTNGTFVDGCRIDGQLPVNAGQIVKFGSIQARLEFDRRELDPGDTDQTAHWAYARFMREKKEKAGQPAPANLPVTPPTVPAPEPEPNTMRLVKPAAATPATADSLPQAANAPIPKITRRNLIRFALGLLLLTLVALGLFMMALRYR